MRTYPRALPSLLMAADDKPKTQKTQPKGINKKTGKPYEPIEIPIPKRGEIEELLRRAAKPGE
jgi:hypothetical protein